MIYVVYVIALLIYIALPLPGQLLFLLLNAFIPDPVPYVDEIVMTISTTRKLGKAVEIWDWINSHKALAAVIGICLLVAVIIILVNLMK